LAAAFTAVVLKRLMDAHFHFDPKATLIAVALTALLSNTSGWLASVRILRQKPMDALRNE
jgi:predicted lysophospholipase L1 biosynthesis ABC-type transport system permease subunit